MLPGKIIPHEPRRARRTSVAETGVESDLPALRIELVRLPKAFRQPVWAWMQKHRPSVCEWLGGEQCKMIRETMGATPALDLNQAEADELLKQLPGLSRYAI